MERGVARTGEGLARSRWLASTRDDGDVKAGAGGATARQTELTGREWTSVHQVHGAAIVTVSEALGALDVDADGLVTDACDVPLAMFGADCALVALTSAEGPLGIAHAGWRGVQAGVIEACADALRELGAKRIVATLSAMIHPECYEFDQRDLVALQRQLGAEVGTTTDLGRPAFDLPTAVRGALRRAGVELGVTAGGCTACGERWFSWRARRDVARHALVCWRPSR